MQYILLREHFFKSYVCGSLKMYVQHKSKPGVWGDDLEIQALSLLYQSEVHIYSA